MKRTIDGCGKGWSFITPGGRRFLPDPAIFAVFSPSGNQWRKLMYFPEDWQDLNILVSTYDVYCADSSIIREMYRLGLRGHMESLSRRMGKKLWQSELPQYAYYRRYIDLDKPFPYRGLLMLDSGGFSLGQPGNLLRLLGSPVPVVRRFARLMLAVDGLEKQERGWKRATYVRLARLAQRAHLHVQLRLQPDIIITLDRIVHFDLPYKIKARRVLFNLTCARTALEFYARTPGPKPLLFAVIHPLGPLPSYDDKAAMSEAATFYTHTFALQIAYLRRAELELGLRFGGFAVGSLVPVANYKFLALLASSFVKALESCGAGGRPLHAFGAAGRKAVFLRKYGFTSFDSNLHVVKARNRQLYDPAVGSYKKGQLPSSCRCPVCRRHQPEEFFESREGVREVATVLQSLHNFYANHLSHLEAMRILDEDP